MRPFAILSIALSMSALEGCGPTAPAPQGSPSGGTMLPLGGDRGFFEVKIEADAVAKGARPKTRTSVIAAYFYGKDGTTPLEPTEVVADLGESGTPVPLKANPGPAKKAGRFASDPGPYPDEIRGTLEAKLGGEPVKVPFAYR